MGQRELLIYCAQYDVTYDRHSYLDDHINSLLGLYPQGGPYTCNLGQWTGSPSCSCYTAGSRTLTYRGRLKSFTVPCGVSTLIIETWGAQGGNSSGQTGTTPYAGGRGAYMRASFSVTAGQTFSAVVGGAGSGFMCGAGGGGASWVYIGSSLYQVSGGGGGAFHCTYYGGATGVDGQTTEQSTQGNCARNNPLYAAPSVGYGGSCYFGGGGAGWNSAGYGAFGGGGATVSGGFSGGNYGGGYGGGGGYYNGGYAFYKCRCSVHVPLPATQLQ